MKDKILYYEIFSELYSINQYRELKVIPYHGTNKLSHISRVGKLSFILSRLLDLDYISCTRGALLYDFSTIDDLKNNSKRELYSYNNSTNYFKINDLEKEIITTNKRSKTKEVRVVRISNKLVAIYEFFRYDIKLFGCNVLLRFAR